jgi:hypothetical protein
LRVAFIVGRLCKLPLLRAAFASPLYELPLPATFIAGHLCKLPLLQAAFASCLYCESPLQVTLTTFIASRLHCVPLQIAFASRLCEWPLLAAFASCLYCEPL